MMQQYVIKITDGVTRMPQWRMREPVRFCLNRGEQLAIVGPNGGGKSLLVDMILGRHPLIMHDVAYDFGEAASGLVSDNMRYMAFRDVYGGDNDRTYYLQQRWNQQEIDENTPTVGTVLAGCGLSDNPSDGDAWHKQLLDMLGLSSMLDKYIILLSSGELRKLKLAEALMHRPKVLVIDNPFIGLDADTRTQLRNILQVLSQRGDIQLILVISKDDDLPPFITHVVEVKDKIVGRKEILNDYLAERRGKHSVGLDADLADAVRQLNALSGNVVPEDIVEMNHVTIAYGNRTILRALDWRVRKGEHWALSGKNGAGKSTLLSLVCADNPQSYACDIALFGRKRGTGESIWDIKKRIGYVSPELHRAYRKDVSVIRVMAGGLSTTTAISTHADESDLEACRFWLRIFGVSRYEDTSFMHLSDGEQRLVLLARAFVRHPDLLILDEPLHGLDMENRQRVKDIIDVYCEDGDKTLIMVTHYQDDLPRCIDHRLTLVRQS